MEGMIRGLGVRILGRGSGNDHRIELGVGKVDIVEKFTKLIKDIKKKLEKMRDQRIGCRALGES